MKGEFALIDAFKSMAVAVKQAQDAQLPVTHETHPAFTYVFTPKQTDDIWKICRQQGWELPLGRGVEITPKDIAHTISSRCGKDSCTAEEVGLILAKAYHAKSRVTLSLKEDRRVIVFSGNKNVQVKNKKWHSTSVLEINDDGAAKYLHITAIHKASV